MQVHLIDGTYELFRYHFAPGGGHVTAAGQEVGATRGVLRSMLSMVRNEGVTHIAIATDSVIESWRNDLYEGYKNGEGVPEELFIAVSAHRRGFGARRFQGVADDRVRS